MRPFFDIGYEGQKALSSKRNEGTIAKETLQDGKFLVKTYSNFESEAMVAAYKELLQVESTFHEIKKLVRLLPIYHWNEAHVRGRVITCVLTYPFEKWLGVLYHRHI